MSLGLYLPVFRGKIQPHGVPLPSQCDGPGIRGIVNHGAVDKDHQSSKLNPAVDRPRFSESIRCHQIKNDQISNPNCRWPKVIQDGMPNAAQTERDEHRKKVVAEDSQAVECHQHLNRGCAFQHLPGVKWIFERAVVVTISVVSNRVEEKGGEEGSPVK